jgi:hypothetical protein
MSACAIFVPSVFLFLVPQFIQIAIETQTIMAADHFAAALTFPRFLLFFKEFLYSMFFHELQVVYHAHPVARPVSFIDGSQPVAWKALALVAESDFAFGQFSALFFQKCTVLISWSAAYAVDHSDAFSLKVMHLC